MSVPKVGLGLLGDIESVTFAIIEFRLSVPCADPEDELEPEVEPVLIIEMLLSEFLDGRPTETFFGLVLILMVETSGHALLDI